MRKRQGIRPRLQFPFHDRFRERRAFSLTVLFREAGDRQKAPISGQSAQLDRRRKSAAFGVLLDRA